MIARSPREGWLVVGLVALGVVLPLAINAAAGVLATPYSDDFTFRRTASALFESGQVRLGGWSIMTFVGQLAAVQPFLVVSDGAPWAFTAVAALFATFGIVAGYALARLCLPPNRAALAVLTVLIVPGFLVTVPTFMTDIPAWAAETSSLALAAFALGRAGAERDRLIATALLLGIVAFSIREFGLAAPVAVLVAVTAAEPARWRRHLLAWAVSLGACATIYLVTSHLPGQAPAQLHAATDADLTLARQSIATIALAASPALALAGRAWIRRGAWRDRPAVIGALVGLGATAVLYWPEIVLAARGGLPTMLVGNTFSAAGSTGSGAGAGIRPILFVAPTWKIINLLALLAVTGGLAIAGAALGERLGRSGTRRRGTERSSPISVLRPAAAWLGSVPGLLVVFAGIYTAGALAFGVVGSLYDRYLWPVVLPVAIALLATTVDRAEAPTGPRAGAGRLLTWTAAAASAMLIGAMATASVALVLNRAAFDQARWDAGRALVATGYPADRVDAGYEWVGFHAVRLVVPDREVQPSERWYHLMVPDYQPCAVVASSAIIESGLELVEVTRDAYRLLLLAGADTPLYVYRSGAAGCP